MAERPLPPTDADLERVLRALGSRLAYPPTPPLAGVVRRRLVSEPAPRLPFWRALVPASRRLALAVLALALLLGAVLAFSPAARTTVADRLGLPGIAIVYITPAPTAVPTAAAMAGTPVSTVTAPPAVLATATPVPAAATPAPASLGARYGLGQRVTLAEARGRVGFPVLTPTLPDLAAPDEVYVGTPPVGGQVALVYRTRPGLPPAVETGPGLLITQFRGDIQPDVFGKGVEPGTQLEQVTVNGGRGYWIAGRPHTFFYRDAGGQIRQESSRLAGNTLIWEQDGVTFRLESALSKEEALRIAASLR